MPSRRVFMTVTAGFILMEVRVANFKSRSIVAIAPSAKAEGAMCRQSRRQLLNRNGRSGEHTGADKCPNPRKQEAVESGQPGTQRVIIANPKE
jgi:hypothetical protein